jgi:hypothetical protein
MIEEKLSYQEISKMKVVNVPVFLAAKQMILENKNSCPELPFKKMLLTIEVQE